MPANYEAFAVSYETSAGVIVRVGAGVSVKVRAEGAVSDLAESPLTTDSNGEIAAGTLSTSSGNVVHFRVENYNGLAGVVSQTTT